MGRADQTAKIKGMFVRPEQVAALVDANAEFERARIVVTRKNDLDVMTVKIETAVKQLTGIESLVKAHLKLSGEVEFVKLGQLPRDGIVIDDQRDFEK